MSTETASIGLIDSLLASAPEGESNESVADALIATLESAKDFHRLFDAKLIKARLKLGLPVAQPTSMDDIPEKHEKAFKDAYVQAAREVGQCFIDDGNLQDAWAYFRTIGEPEPIRAAIEKVRVPREPDEEFDHVMNLALYEGAHISKGLEFLLKTHGTCNTVTAFGQLQQQMTPEERRTSAAMMVKNIYNDLQQTVRRDVESRMPVLSADAGIAELIKGRDWLFADGNYHIDVSHLHSTVGFARALEPNDPELPLAVELCAYGKMLSPPLQYPGDVPFDEFYTAHDHFLKAISGEAIDEGIAYFTGRLEQEPDEPDQQLIAYVLWISPSAAERSRTSYQTWPDS